MRGCAIFDLDGTIIDNSSEQVFLKYLIELGELPVGNLLRWAMDFIRLRDLREAKANKVYLQGACEARLRSLAHDCFQERLAQHISPKIPQLMEQHRACGRAVVILSGSLELLVEQFHRWLHTDSMVGYRLEVREGKVTGGRIGLNPYGENKAKLTQALAAQHGFELSASYAYGNHASDAHKLRLVGNPVAANPDRKLRRIAQRNGWPIVRFHE